MNALRPSRKRALTICVFVSLCAGLATWYVMNAPRTLIGDDGPIWDIKTDSATGALYVARRSGAVDIFVSSEKGSLHRIPLPDQVLAVTSPGDGKQLFAGCRSGVLHSIDVVASRDRASVVAHSGALFDLCLLSDAGSVVTCGSGEGDIGTEGEIIAWSRADLHELHKVALSCTVLCIAAPTQHGHVCGGTTDGQLLLFDVPGLDQDGRQLRPGSGIVFDVAYSVDGRLLFAGGQFGLCCYRCEDWSEVYTPQIDGEVWRLAPSPTHASQVVLATDNGVYVVDIASRSAYRVKWAPKRSHGLSISLDGRYLFVADRGSVVLIAVQ